MINTFINLAIRNIVTLIAVYQFAPDFHPKTRMKNILLVLSEGKRLSYLMIIGIILITVAAIKAVIALSLKQDTVKTNNISL